MFLTMLDRHVSHVLDTGALAILDDPWQLQLRELRSRANQEERQPKLRENNIMATVEPAQKAQSNQVSLALDILENFRFGTIDRARVTEDFSFWWNRDERFTFDTFAESLAGLHAATVDGVTVTPKLAIAQDDTVMVEATSHAPMKDGRVYANRYVYVFQFRGNLISEVREYCDTAHVAEIFGMGA